VEIETPAPIELQPRLPSAAIVADPASSAANTESEAVAQTSVSSAAKTAR
jgi:hypothetical protein